MGRLVGDTLALEFAHVKRQIPVDLVEPASLAAVHSSCFLYQHRSTADHASVLQAG